ncbi:talin-1-like isoform X1 [Saccostrea echinata]|uniref:talin-1-like isoform X1 n=1 Tax=Saccostrea echinata TaxID=191078 RepID=UPI002A83F630|nr:talin-1-like isoform X1 [Saccostrea echinata]XP_061190932.1 talin-1-like isoform X1 [Saccostrea echinata]
MAMLSLKISVVGNNVVKTMQFEPSTQVYDACKIIRDRIIETNPGNPQDYGLFLADEDPKKGVWLEPGRTLDYYLLRNGDLLEYKKKMRILQIKTLDGMQKKLQVDDSHTVGQLMVTICTKMGISNHEEYSLVREMTDDEKEKTLTLRRDKSIAKDQKKLEEMRKKLHTDDELEWLDHSRTLREQGVADTDTLLLRRKFFFSDQNVDQRDPVQLNLLYVQSRDAILDGTHPVTLEEAISLAGIQVHIQFGDYIENKHKPGFLDVKEFLPKEYVKTPKIEKRIFAEHKKWVGVHEFEAKAKYTQKCRGLKTYGITFFLVKEKMPGKNKLVPRLLGITKESVVRMDEKTKEIMKTWPLTTVKRWAASPNSFTLDFGDYSDSYYSVQTQEGEQISRLIAGYIDIILKRKKDKDHLGIEGSDEAPMYEDSVSPAKATIISRMQGNVSHPDVASVAMPGVMRGGVSGETQISMGSMSSAQHGQVSNEMHMVHGNRQSQNIQEYGLSQSQRALLTCIEEGITSIRQAESQMDKGAALPNLGNDAASKKWRQNMLDLSRQKVGAQLSAMNAATAQLVTMSIDDEIDTSRVGAAVAQITSNIDDFSQDVRMLGALQDDDESRNKLLGAAKRLCGAFSDLLSAAEPGQKESKSNLISAAKTVGEASQEVMQGIGETADDMDKMYQETLLALAKAVANATAQLVLKAKNVASTTEDQGLQNKVISSATSCALATSQLVACTKVVAPTISSPACQEQLIEAAKGVAHSVEGIVEAAQQSCRDDKLLADLGGAATAVTQALNDLLQHIKKGAGPTTAGESHEDAVDTILTVTDRLFSSVGDAHEMVRQARHLAQATSSLVGAIRSEAEGHSDSDMQKRLLAAARQLADATANMVEAAKGCASSPNDSDKQGRLRSAAEDLRAATNIAASNALKKKLIRRLENAARRTASATTQLINASKNANKSNTNTSSEHQLTQQCQIMNEQLPLLIQGFRKSETNQDSATAQLQLINASKEFIQPASQLVSAANAAAPTVGDQSASINLNQAVKTMTTALAELRSASGKAEEMCISLEVDAALDQLNGLDKDLEEYRRAVDSGNLVPLPGDTAESSASKLGSTSKNVGSAMAQLLTAASQGNENYVGVAARDTANALRVLTESTRGVAATSEDIEVKRQVIDSAREVIDKSTRLLEETKRAMNDPDNPENQSRLNQVAKAVSAALNNCVNALPGQRDVDNTIRQITSSSQELATTQYPSTDRTFQEVQIEINNAAVNLNQAASDIVTASRGTPKQLAESSQVYGSSYSEFIKSGLTMAGLSKDVDTQNQIVGGLKNVSMVSSKLLLAAKSVSADPNAPNTKNLLSQAARAVTESINQLINVCTVSAPGQKECDNALRQIQMMKSMLESANEPVTDMSYFECLDSVMEKSKILGDSMTGITNHAKKGDLVNFCDSVGNFSTSVCGLTEAASQAAYLVGIADGASEPGQPGLVDQSQFARANQAIQMACQNLINPASSQQQVLSAATVVAKHTSALCNACRLASSKTSNPVAKRHFVQSAKDVANSTANLVKAIKALDQDFTEENRQKCAEAAKPLTDAVDELTTFASSPEFASMPAKISPQARKAQEPIIAAGKAMIDGACNMVTAAKQLAVNPKDPPTYQLYSNHSKSVSEAIKRLVSSIKDCAPGQRECDESIEKLNRSIRDLDQASLAAISQSLQQRTEKSLRGFQEQMIGSAREIHDLCTKVKDSAKAEPENLGHRVTMMASYFGPLSDGAVGAASLIQNSKQQTHILDLTKTVAESALQFMYSCKEGGGNPKAPKHTHDNIDTAAENTMDVVQDLLQSLEEAASQAGMVNSMIEKLTKSITKTDEQVMVREGMSFVEYQSNMVSLAKKIAMTTQEMVGKAGVNPADLGRLANQLTRDYDILASNSANAAATASGQDIANRIRTTVQDLGKSCVELVQDAGKVQGDPHDTFARRDLQDHARSVSEKVSFVLAALQSGSRGTQACINAASAVSGIIADLDTTIMFATAGTLSTEGDDSFASHREDILKTAKALVEETKKLVQGAASDQETLAGAAQQAVKTITKLADVVKLGAASLGSDQPEAQVMIINAVKDVASALSDLISATKNASGKNVSDPAMLTLKESAKVMVTNVTSLLKTVKTVEDEAARGTRALESTIEAIGQEIKSYEAGTLPEKKATAEDLIRLTKPITTATAKAVAAGNSARQEDVIICANMGRKAIFDLLATCRGTASTAETTEVRQKTIQAGKSCAVVYKDLLEQVSVVVQKPSQESKQTLAALSRQVATSVQEVVHCAELIKGTDWVDPEDPTVIAESELLTAAKSIEAAAQKLSQLKPRKKAKEADMSLNFEEQILEAAKSIASATAALVKSASAAQRELVAQGKVRTRREIGATYHKSQILDDDGQWSEGLISAAKLVAAATHSLCESANAMVQGHATEERLIASAKEVAGSTAHLLVACRVKADPNSVAMKRLQAAGNAVKRATEVLVKAAQQAKQRDEDEEIDVAVDSRKVGGIKQELQFQEEMLRKEREWIEAREKLAKFRKQRYKDAPHDSDSSSAF